jgi:hypothetical protein
MTTSKPYRKLPAITNRLSCAAPLPPRLPASDRLWFTLILPNLAGSCTALISAQTPSDLAAGLELSRAAHPREFIKATGSRAALLVNESGRFDA